jgi:CheY-like chemotaxis protein
MPQAPSRSSRIAVIDDDPVFLELMHDLLAASEGYEVVSSGDWLHSLEFIKSAQPDLVMLDLMMGRNQSGWAVLELLAEDAATRSIPIILCSAAAPSLEEHAGRIRAHATVAAVSKPFDVDDLLQTIERMLEARGALTA